MDQMYKALWYVVPGSRSSAEVKTVVKTGLQAGRMVGAGFVRVAGLSGAIAVLMGAYGVHAIQKDKLKSDEAKLAFNTGNRYHLVHSVALLATPLTKRPYLVGGLMLTGMVFFSGSCYVFAITERAEVRRVAPVGGVLLVAAWLCMVL